jgi:hypothetical protein
MRTHVKHAIDDATLAGCISISKSVSIDDAPAKRRIVVSARVHEARRKS